MNQPGEELSVICEFQSLSAVQVLRSIRHILAGHPEEGSLFDLYPHQNISLDKAEAYLEKSNDKHFGLIGGGYECHFGAVARSHFDLLLIKSAAPPSIPWDDWATELIKLPRFVMAWVADIEYACWQSELDPETYEAVGRLHKHLPRLRTGAPVPLRQEVIDITRNPGRRINRDGYVEAVGATMWFGEPFWTVTGADRKQLEAMEELRISECGLGLIRVEAAGECFRAAEGAIGKLQEKLHSVLFPNAKLTKPWFIHTA